jgi:hypothetical protein
VLISPSLRAVADLTLLWQIISVKRNEFLILLWGWLAIKFAYMNDDPSVCFSRVSAFAVDPFHWNYPCLLLMNDVAY